MMSGRNNAHIPLIVVLFLGVFCLTALWGTIWLVFNKSDPAVVAIISGLCGTSLGLMGSVLSKTDREHSDKATSVVIENLSDNPVPVEEMEK